MRKILTAGAAALTCLGSLGATTAQAQGHGGWHGGGGGGWHGGGGGWHGGGEGWHGGWGGRGWGGRGWGYAGAGLAGFALGAALADRPYYGGYYGYGYPGYYGYDDYGQCVGTRRVWDPYYGGYVLRRVYYAC